MHGTETADFDQPTQDVPKKRGVRIGPGLLVAAAFIGPGTVVTASRAGAGFGGELLWAVIVAVIGAVVLQLLAARLGILSGKGLGASIRSSLRQHVWFLPTTILVIGAIGIGNAAYQTGNLTGAAAGLQTVFGGKASYWVGAIVAATFVILALGRYQSIQSLLIGLVALLSLCFIVALIRILPEATGVLRGALTPRVTAENLTLVIALIGTTIVPYNLFLHSSSAAENWRGMEPKIALRQSMWDTVLSISLGGLVTAAILITASVAFADQRTTQLAIGEINEQLQPSLGPFSAIAFGIGLFAAGLTSSITAPLATAYAVCGVLGWKDDGTHAKVIALIVLVVGGILAVLFGKSPAQAIIFAQLANGMLLPVLAVFLIVLVIRKSKQLESPIGASFRSLAWIIVVAVASLGIWRAWLTLRNVLD